MVEEDPVMKTKETINRFEPLIPVFILSLISAVVYLFFIRRFSYFNDDWYLMYAAGAKGPSAFWDIFIVDRPMRAFVMAPAYLIFGNNPVFYNISAWGFRVLSAVLFFRLLCFLWPDQKKISWMSALLYLIYPGFLSQFNGIDYQSQMVSLALGMLSVALLFHAYRHPNLKVLLVSIVFLTVTTTFYLGLVEYFIGLEVFKLACLAMLVFRDQMNWRGTAKKMIYWMSYSLLALLPFLVWRLFFFHSERGATDVDLQLGTLRSKPFTFLFDHLSTFLNDFMDVLIRAWWLPLRRLSAGMSAQEWLPGFGIALSVLLILWIFSRAAPKPEETASGMRSNWKREMFILGLGTIVFGLLPVILVGRTVDFKNYSRYALIASLGVALLWPLALSYISNVRLRNIVFGILIISASLTHYFNGFVRAREAEATRNFWWQVSWRIPQINPGTTLITRYSVAAEEDYFTWGPANLLYHPRSNNESYVEPSTFALVLNEETVAKVITREPKAYSNRRNIRTYPNYRNILILTQPTPVSCVQVIDSHQVELSTFEDTRVAEMAPYSEAEHISLNESFQVPPAIPFGSQPPHGWCFYYEKASYARQLGNWDEVLSLGEQAISQGFFAKDQIEWMPFLQAYAYADQTARLKDLASFMTSDLPALQQACHILTAMPLNSATSKKINQLFCSK
jgi:hypothetical protein